MHRTDKEFLFDILEACKRITQYIKGLNYEDFLKNTEKQDAVIRNIEVIGEAVKSISKELRNKYSDINWKNIAGMRDKLIHFYFGIKLEIVWIVATQEIPQLQKQIEQIMRQENWQS